MTTGKTRKIWWEGIPSALIIKYIIKNVPTTEGPSSSFQRHCLSTVGQLDVDPSILWPINRSLCLSGSIPAVDGHVHPYLAHLHGSAGRLRLPLAGAGRRQQQSRHHADTEKNMYKLMFHKASAFVSSSFHHLHSLRRRSRPGVRRSSSGRPHSRRP